MKALFEYGSIIIGAALAAWGFNQFLIPHSMISGGISGIAMFLGYLTNWNIGITYFALNVPILIWGWRTIGRRFIVLSILSVIVTTWFMQLIPEYQFNSEPMLAAIFGGVLIGFGTGISFRAGGSTGGMDIIAAIITRTRDFPLGTFLFAINGIIIAALGYYKGSWDPALFSMLSIYIAGRIVDTIHIRHIKVTAFIITTQKQKMIEQLLKIPRGVTTIKTQGAFTHQERDMIMTVTTRYELAELRKIIKETDPKAFVNIVETVGVMGEFRRT
ncbi:YitT family protein [Paenibacillus turpanensis]|uniref:YitT family protein n=1 Tax=Paenibacillus turpanensis TaxID=2689078 RepID=UPI00140AF91B|nr:YitT family protein [Paenibacillus turpanensis]